MHELSVCQALLDQVESIARNHGAERVDRILLKVGPLSGVEASLLRSAYPLAASGTVAEDAELVIETLAVRVRCRECHAVSEVPANRLLCSDCGSYQTDVVSGDEMLLASVELITPDDDRGSAPE